MSSTTRARYHAGRRRLAVTAVASAGLMIAVLAAGGPASAVAGSQPVPATSASGASTSTPIKHVVVIYDENISFDHYFGTYPNAANPPGEPAFHAAVGTPTVNGLTPTLLTNNPNSANPQRLDRSEALTCDQDHSYTAEQKAFDHGLMDKFVESTQHASCAPPYVSKPGLGMDYYDGNTVTALWNYAQHFAMSDNSYSTVFGPTVPGHLNLVSGQTHGAIASKPSAAVVNGTVISTSVSAMFEDCPKTPTAPKVEMTGPNVGDLLNSQNTSWGWFSGGFRPTSRTAEGTAVCGSGHTNIGGITMGDYHDTLEPFQYYRSTANPHHLPPLSTAEVGHNGPANHQYDLTDFWGAVDAGQMPAVSFLKPPVYQDGHADSSDPIDEQRFLVDTINRLQQTPDWKDTAVVIAYDDSDGWYDHQMSPIVNDSQSPQDALSGDGLCGARTPLAGYQNRCGYGPRQPLLVISPYSKVNAVDHTITDQTSILKFIEDNWLGGQRIGDGSFDALAGPLTGMFDFAHPAAQPLLLNPGTGQPSPGGADLRVQVYTPLSASAGKTVTATVTVTNTGPAAAGPTHTTFAALGAGAITNPGGGTVHGLLDTFTTPTLDAQRTLTYTVTLKAPSAFSLGVTGAYALSDTPDPDLFNNIAVAAVLTH